MTKHNSISSVLAMMKAGIKVNRPSHELPASVVKTFIWARRITYLLMNLLSIYGLYKLIF